MSKVTLGPRRALIVSATLWLAAGCGNSASFGDNALHPSSLVSGVDGVTVGAPAGALGASVKVFIERFPEPEVALPDGFKAAGSVYLVAAETLTEAPADSTFVVGLPRPSGLEASHSAIAVLAEDGHVRDGPKGDWWMVHHAQHDLESDLLLLALPTLLPEGSILTVVSVLDPAETHSTDGSVTKKAAMPLVEAKCSPKFNGQTTGCTTAARASLEQTFEAVYQILQTAGYPEPVLQRSRPLGISISWLGKPVGSAPFQFVIEPCAVRPDYGAYDPVTHTLVVCIPSTGPDELSEQTVRHELFHAIQYAFPAVHDEWQANDVPVEWGVEAQAAAAEHSLIPELLRSPHFNPRVVSAGLFEQSVKKTDPLHEYDAQDFWVYLGLRLNRGLDVFIPFLERGLLPTAVDTTLTYQIANQDVPTLSDAYWAWVKNQVFEWEFPLPTGNSPSAAAPGARNPCNWESSLDDSPLLASFDPASGLSGADASTPSRIEFRASDPLQSRSASILLTAPRGYLAKISVDSTDPDLRYKIYQDGEPGCAGDPEDSARTIEVRQGNDVHVVVVAANTSTTAPLDPSAIEVELVEIALDPPGANLIGSIGAPAGGAFLILNGGGNEISHTASSNAPWLVVTQNAAGIVPANGSIDVSFEATCPSSGTSRGKIELEFKDSAGNVISGKDVPRAFPVELLCEEDDPDPAPLQCNSGPRSYIASVTITRLWRTDLSGFLSSSTSAQGNEVCDGLDCEWSQSFSTTETYKPVEGDNVENTSEWEGLRSAPLSFVPAKGLINSWHCSDTGMLHLPGNGGSETLHHANGQPMVSVSWSCVGCECLNSGNPPDGCCPQPCNPTECEGEPNGILPSGPGCMGSGGTCSRYVPAWLAPGVTMCDGFISAN